MKTIWPFRIIAHSGGERLLHLHDHLGLRPDLGGVRADPRARRGERVVGEAGFRSGAGFDDDLVPAPHESVGSGGGEGHAALVGFGFFGDAYEHREV